MVLPYRLTNSGQNFFTVHAGVVSFGPAFSQSVCPGILSLSASFRSTAHACGSVICSMSALAFRSKFVVAQAQVCGCIFIPSCGESVADVARLCRGNSIQQLFANGCCTNGQSVQLKLNTCQPNCTSTCEPGPNGFMTVLTTCPGPAAVLLDRTRASPSMATIAARSHDNLALPVPQPFNPQQVTTSDVVMIVGGAVLLVVGISLVAVLQ